MVSGFTKFIPRGQIPTAQYYNNDEYNDKFDSKYFLKNVTKKERKTCVDFDPCCQSRGLTREWQSGGESTFTFVWN